MWKIFQFGLFLCIVAEDTFSYGMETCGLSGGGESRIYGGQPVSEGDLPWMTVLYYKRRKDPHCGASIINRKFLLTAAHCITGDIVKFYGEPFYARMGVQNLSSVSTPGDIYGISDIIPHPNYDERAVNRGADIGLLKVDRRIDYYSSVSPVCLPSWEAPIGTSLTVAGWGKTPYAYFNDQKLKTTLRVLANPVCHAAYAKTKLILDPGQFCTGGSGSSDTCRGDSGNGLYEVHEGLYFVQGIVSFGPSACGYEHLPSISTKVHHFAKWIHEHAAATAAALT